VTGDFTLGQASGGTGILTLSGSMDLGGSMRQITIANTTDTISGIISGAGGLTKAGTGTLVLTGANTFSGGTTLSSGSLLLGNNAALGTGTLELAGGTLASSSTTARTLTNLTSVTGDFTLGQASGGTGALTLSGAMTLGAGLHQITVDNTSDTISGVISGSGGLTKAGTGALTLSGTNTYTGTTTINAGILRAGADNTLPTGGAVTLANTAGAALDLNGFNVTIGSLAGGGTTGGYVTLGTGTLTVGGASSGTYAGVISGTGGLTKAGTGTLVLSGANTYTGTTTLDGGSLAVTGSIQSPVVINPSGVLTSNSNIVGNVTNNGKVAPGNSIGVITITGNYTHNPGSVYEVETNPEGQSDKLVVTGTATLNGGTVSVLAGSGVYKMRTYYTILTAGNVTGAFANVTSDLAYLTPSLSYDAGHVYLFLARNSTDFSGVASTGNQRAVACALDRISTSARGDMEDVVNAVLGLSAPGARSSYEQMGGLSHTALAATTFSSFRGYMGAMTERSRSLMTGQPSSAFAERPVMLAFKGGDRASDAGNTLLAALGRTGDTDLPYRGLWVKGYGGTGDRGGGDAASRYGYDMAGIVAGFDRHVADSFILGISLGYSSTRTSMRDLTDKATVSSYQAGLYGMYRRDPWYLSAAAAFGYNRYDTQRDISFGEIVRSAKARYDGHSLGGYLETGYRVETRGADIIPMVSLMGGRLTRDGFRERNAGAVSLDVDGDRSSFLLGSLGVRLRKDYAFSSGVFTPEITVRWDHDLVGDDYVLDGRFAGQPLSVFTTRGERGDRNSFAPGFGLSLRTEKNVYFQLTYDGNFAGDSTQHRATLGLRYTW
jgi:autotransporter-associated beta strand protein